MNKTELIAEVAEATGFTKKNTEKAVNALLDSIKKEIAGGDRVQLVGFGTFDSRKRAARKGKNPQTGEEIRIAASTVPVFKAGKKFKALLNK